MSRKLICTAEHCVHNINGLCTASTIHVLGMEARMRKETACETFAERGLFNALTHSFNMNVPGEIRQLFTNESIEMSPKVRCEASNCLYNENRICGADYLQIGGIGAKTTEETQCLTFTPDM